MPTKVVGIDSFDSPNFPVVAPKKNVPAVARGAPFYHNPGPMKRKHRDRRSGAGSMPEIDGGTQYVQLLMLTSGPNPLLQAQGYPVAALGAQPVWAPWKTDIKPNGVPIVVGDALADMRYKGYHKRDDLVDTRVQIDPRIQILWERNVPNATAYANDVSAAGIYHDFSRVRRVRLNVRDKFVVAGSGAVAPIYSQNDRYIWCPAGIRRSDVQYGATATAMTAIGCTCRDMLMRGVTDARYGCKHIIAYNKAQAAGSLI
jgi:hypothetical protein